MANWTDEELKHTIRCVKDPIYLLDLFCWMDADDGIIPFAVGKSPEEDFFYQYEIIEHLLKGENVAILKARRVGLSWIAAFYTAWLINFHRGINVLFVSENEKKAISLLNKVKFILKNLAFKDASELTEATPADFLKSKWVVDNQTELGIGHVDDTGEVTSISSVKSLTTTKRSGAGEKAKFVFLDEVQFIENQDEVFAAALTTTKRAGHWLMGSNAGDVGTRFHHLCMQGRTGENRSYWYREVSFEEAGITEEVVEKDREILTDDLMGQEWYLQFRQSGNAVFDITHLAACFKPPDMFPEIKQKLDDYRELVMTSNGRFKYYSGVDSAMGKAHRKSREKDYNCFSALTQDAIQAFAYFDKKPLSTWAGANENGTNGEIISNPGKVSELHAKWPGLCTIEENGPGLVVISRHHTPVDGFSQTRSIDIKHHIKSRIIKNLIIAVESHTIVITDEKTYQQLSLFQFGDLPDTYECPKGSNDDGVLALAEAYDGLMLEGGYEIVFGSGSTLDTLERKPYDQAYHRLRDLQHAIVAPAIAYRDLPGVRVSSLMPLPFEEFARTIDSRFMPDESILKRINEKMRKFGG